MYDPCTAAQSIDPDLHTLTQSWPTLPSHVRQTILDIVAGATVQDVPGLSSNPVIRDLQLRKPRKPIKDAKPASDA
jgi:hypothetical protein